MYRIKGSWKKPLEIFGRAPKFILPGTNQSIAAFRLRQSWDPSTSCCPAPVLWKLQTGLRKRPAVKISSTVPRKLRGLLTFTAASSLEIQTLGVLFGREVTGLI